RFFIQRSRSSTVVGRRLYGSPPPQRKERELEKHRKLLRCLDLQTRATNARFIRLNITPTKPDEHLPHRAENFRSWWMDHDEKEYVRPMAAVYIKVLMTEDVNLRDFSLKDLKSKMLNPIITPGAMARDIKRGYYW
ncbi:hypothetical protein V8G54_004855, partial [Vigna mungo]